MPNQRYLRKDERVSTGAASLSVNRAPLHCHDWYSVAEIGGWLHGSTAESMAPVREWAARPDLWERSATSHQDLTAAISAAGGITCEHALQARTAPEGVHLEDGVHRWTIAAELGLDLVPVEMAVETESAFAW
jgi:hypothetical protein